MPTNDYAIRPKKLGLTLEQARKYLLELFAMDQRVFTSLVNLNSKTHRYAYVALYVVHENKPVNISYYAALVCGLRCKSDGPTDFLQVERGIDLGKWAVQRLQKDLYKDLYLTETLTQEWV